MKKLTYTHSTSVRIEIDGAEYYFEAGNTYELPSENAYIATMLKQGYFVPVIDEKTTKTKRT